MTGEFHFPQFRWLLLVGLWVAAFTLALFVGLRLIGLPQIIAQSVSFLAAGLLSGAWVVRGMLSRLDAQEPGRKQEPPTT